MILIGVYRVGAIPRVNFFCLSLNVKSFHSVRVFHHRHTALTSCRWNKSVFESSFLTKNRWYSTKRPLEISHPRLYKRYEIERAADNLSRDWELIFTQGGFKRKLGAALWASFTALLVLPFFGLYNWWQSELEEDVSFANITLTKRTEWILFIVFNVIMFGALHRNICNVPLRIYLNENSGSYLAVRRSFLPWKEVRAEFQTTDVEDTPGKTFPLRIKPWAYNEYFINRKMFHLPSTFFRSSHDKEQMLRHKNWRQNLQE